MESGQDSGPDLGIDSGADSGLDSGRYLEVVDHLLSTTRAVRRRLDLDRPVEREVILDCLRLAQQAPTASNNQDWHWVVVTDDDKKQAIADRYNGAGMEYLRQAAETAEGQTKRVYDSALALTAILPRVPVMVIPCIRQRVEGLPNGVVASAYGSIIPAAWSFMLALRSRGLGSVWTTLHLFSEREVADLLGIPDGVTQVAMIPVGYTTGGDFKPAVRPPVSEIVSWNSWDAT